MTMERKAWTGRRALVPALTLAVCCAGAAASAAGGDGRAMSLEDLYRVKAPSSVRFSPDGQTLYYVLETRDLPRGKSDADLYRIPLAGGDAQRLTHTPESRESSPAVSPDGRLVAFVAARGEEEAIWLLPTQGGEARRLAAVSTGASGLVWSPDGRHLAFASEVFPACGADDACNKKRSQMRAKGPLQAHVADELLYRHWNFWYDGAVSHVLVVEVASGKVRDLTPGEREAPVFSAGASGGFAFSPDGKQLAFTRNPDPKERLASSTNSDVWVVPVDPGPDGGAPAARNQTAGNLAWDGDPAFSPDGRFLAYRRQLQPGYESDRFTLTLQDLASGQVRVLTEGLDNWVTHAEWLPDSKGLLFQADVAGQTPLFRVGVEASAPQKVAELALFDEYTISPDGRTAVAVRRSVAQPAEIWRFSLSGSQPPVRVTTHNLALEQEVDFRPAEQHWVEGSQGRKIHTFLVKPHGFQPGKKYPAIVNIHGGPQMQWADAFRGDWQVYPAAGYVVVFPNPHGSTGYGQAFTAAISGDYTGAVMEDIAKVTDWVETLAFVDRERIGIMGWSWGGYAVNWLLGTTDRYRAIASMMGVFDLPSMYGATEELWYPEWDAKGTPWTSDLYQQHSPARNAANFRTPTLVLTGEKDYRVPYTQSLMLFTYLRKNGVPSRLIVFPGAGHWPSWYEMVLYYTAHLEWFHSYLGGGPPPWSTEAFAANAVFDPETGKRRE